MKKWSFDVHGSLLGCSFCFKNHKRCTYQLARMNKHWMSLTLDLTHLTSSSPTGQAISLPAAGFLSALPLQPTLDLMPVKQRQERQQQYSNQPLIVGQPLINVASSNSSSSKRRKTPASITTPKTRFPSEKNYHRLLGLLQQYALVTSLFLVSFPCEEITDTNQFPLTWKTPNTASMQKLKPAKRPKTSCLRV